MTRRHKTSIGAIEEEGSEEGLSFTRRDERGERQDTSIKKKENERWCLRGEGAEL